MSLNIKYNASGTITVECGDEAVEIHPVRVKSPTLDVPVTPPTVVRPQPAPPIDVPVTPPIVVGPQPASTPRKPPKTGPRVAIRIPWLPSTEDVDPLVLDSAIQLEQFISPKPLFTWSAESIENIGGINVKIEPNQSVEVKTLMDKMQSSDSDDLTLWMMPDLDIDK